MLKSTAVFWSDFATLFRRSNDTSTAEVRSLLDCIALGRSAGRDTVTDGASAEPQE